MKIKYLIFYLFMYHFIIIPPTICGFIFFPINGFGNIVLLIFIFLIIDVLLFILQNAWKVFFSQIFFVSPVAFSAIALESILQLPKIPHNPWLYALLLPFAAFVYFAYYQIENHERFWILYLGGFVTWLLSFLICFNINSLHMYPMSEITLVFLFIYAFVIWVLFGINFYLCLKNEDYTY